MRGLDPRIHHLRKKASFRWIAGASPAMTIYGEPGRLFALFARLIVIGFVLNPM